MFGLFIAIFSSSTFDPGAATLSVVPNILGFTVGALAILLAFSSSDFFTYLIDGGKERSLFMMTVAKFVHFIMVQVLSILMAILYLATSNCFLRTITSIVLTYAILTTLSTVIQLFEMASVFNASRRVGSGKDKQTPA
jgi:hypothetical protein